MTITYEIIDKNNGVIIGRGISEYKSYDRFLDFELYGDENVVNDNLKAGNIIDVYIDDVFERRWKNTPTAFLGMWDNYDADAPERMEAIVKVVGILKEEPEVEISFSYNGRTRHDIAAHAFKEALQKLGYKFKYIIGDNYDFKILNR